MAQSVLGGASAVRAASFPVRAVKDPSPEERLEELKLETFGWALAELQVAEPNLERFSTRTIWEVVEAIAETNSVEVMG